MRSGFLGTGESLEHRLEFRVLGRLEIIQDGRPVHVSGVQPRNVLARLLVDAGHRVSVSALVEELWGEHGPADADRTARTYVSRLRAALRPLPEPHRDGREHDGPRADAVDGVLVTLPSGYELRIDPGAVDAVQFERLAASGRRELERGEPRVAAEQLAEALALWRGDAYAEFDGCPTVSAEGTRLNRIRLAVLEDRIAAASALGLDAELVNDLEGLVKAHPLRERLWGHLMVGLYRSGRQAEALAAYRDARSVLIDHHGVEPSPRLAELHRRILNHDRSLIEAERVVPEATSLPAASAAPVRPAGDRVIMPVPAQLPIGVRDFTGRRAELAVLDALLAGAGASPTAVICAMSGTAGVGKSSLALHWAGRMSAQFPDGQLYVDLRGFGPGGSVLDPADALRGFLEALGVPATRIPAGVDDRATLFRTVLAGKRALVILDNARDARHVRPLLPSSPGSMALVTSRTSLAGLEAAERAHRLVVDVLTPNDAQDLLASRLGSELVAAECDDADEVIDRCARLPLALAIAAARPHASPSRLAARLRAASGGLEAFELNDDAVNLRAAFSWSYQLLSEQSARLFRLLGCRPGPDVTASEAAILSKLTRQRARECLRELLDANLITESAPGRYGSHRLLRAYAAECARVLEIRTASVPHPRLPASNAVTAGRPTSRGNWTLRPTAGREPGVPSSAVMERDGTPSW
ncbi:MAG: hypothetical protein QOD41_998 [Cryptosporangiaceae bacterium]|nr:hypothetical protein [Cryptosporangiaceae bacterium]